MIHIVSVPRANRNVDISRLLWQVANMIIETTQHLTRIRGSEPADSGYAFGDPDLGVRCNNTERRLTYENSKTQSPTFGSALGRLCHRMFRWTYDKFLFVLRACFLQSCG